jgi:alkylhydroperoxidase family enzyme
MSVVEKIEDAGDDAEIKELYERFARSGFPGGVLNIFKVMAHNPPLLRSWSRLGTRLLTGGITLSPRLRELAILRVGQLSGSEYEFGQHIRIAASAGVSYEEMAALQGYADGELFSELERAVLAYVDACARLDPDAGDRARDLKRWLSDRELVELSVCVGYWGMVARILVPLEVELDEELMGELPAEWREWM